MKEQLLAALHEGGGTLEELTADLYAGRAQLWSGERAGLVTQVNEGGGQRHLHVWLAGGELREILSMIPGVIAWGRAQGCAAVTVNGRKGWSRTLAPYGFRAVDGELRKTL